MSEPEAGRNGRPGMLMDILTGAWSLLQGLGVTMRNLLRPKVTELYPRTRPALPERTRHRLVHKRDAETGRLKCTACQLCFQACPCLAITNITGDENKGKERRARTYEWSAVRCMYCNLCVEVCPFDAIVMSPHFEFSTTDKATTHYNLERLLESEPGATETIRDEARAREQAEAARP